MIDGAIRLVIVAVESFGGMVTDLAGDGAMCIFGAPVAHEDDAERAILAGLRIADDARAYGQQLMDQWACRSSPCGSASNRASWSSEPRARGAWWRTQRQAMR